MNLASCICSATVICLLNSLPAQCREVLFAAAENPEAVSTEVFPMRAVCRFDFTPLYINQVCDSCFMWSQSIRLLRRDFLFLLIYEVIFSAAS